MSRADSLDRRLSSLEAQLLSGVLAELDTVANGGASMYFTRKREHIADGRKYQDERTGELESLEREVAVLSEKLGVPTQSQALALVAEFSARLANTENSWAGGKVALARELLARVKHGASLERTRE